MNQIGLSFRDADNRLEYDPPAATDVVSLERLLGILRRRRFGLGLATALGGLLALAYVAMTPREYVASARVLMDDRLSRMAEQVAASSTILRDDAALANQIEVLRSEQIATVVARDLNLAENARFQNPPQAAYARAIGALKSTLKGLIAPAPPEPATSDDATAWPEDPALAMARNLQRAVRVSRVGRSQVIEVGFASHDPTLAADLSNAYAEAYLADQLNASFDAAQRTSDWLSHRLSELYASSQEAALAVESFRAEHGLAASRGQLITEQKLSQLNVQLGEAEAETARAAALLDQVRAVVEGGPDEVLATAAAGPNLTGDPRLAQLQERFAAVTARLSSVEADFGPTHAQAEALRAQRSELARTVTAEYNRLLAHAEGEFRIAEANERALKASVAEADNRNALAAQTQVRLRELEQRASTLAGHYESLLTRLGEIDQQGSYPVSNVRILTRAVAPLSAASPSTMRALATGLVLGALAGLVLLVVAEFRDRTLRTGQDVTAQAGIRFLGYLPRSGARPRGWFSRLLGRAQGPETARPLFFSITEPRSYFAETLRNIRMSADLALLDAPCKILGITSSLPGEGKSAVASNLANLLAISGHDTLLIDADMRNPGLTRALRISDGAGLVEIATGRTNWLEAVRSIGASNLHVLPCLTEARIANSSDLLQSPAVEAFLEEAQTRYAYIIFDLPPAGAVVDTKAMLSRLHKLVYVAEWGRTPRALLRQTLEREPAVKARILGAVLNKVDVEAVAQYGDPGGPEGHLAAYKAYLSRAA